MQKHKQFLSEAIARKQRMDFEYDIEMRRKEAEEKGFVVGKKVRMTGDSEIGEIVGDDESGGRYTLKVKFERGEFPYFIRELELVEEK